MLHIKDFLMDQDILILNLKEVKTPTVLMVEIFILIKKIEKFEFLKLAGLNLEIKIILVV